MAVLTVPSSRRTEHLFSLRHLMVIRALARKPRLDNGEQHGASENAEDVAEGRGRRRKESLDALPLEFFIASHPASAAKN